MLPAPLLAWLSSLPPAERDAALEERFGLPRSPPRAPPGQDLIGYYPSGVAPIVRMLTEIPVTADDVLLDLGAGAGKVLLLTRLLTGATARGIELQPSLVTAGAEAARRTGIAISLSLGDARTTPLDDGTVFYLYLPFRGAVMNEVMARLRTVASHHAIVVCTLGVDIERYAPWLTRRALDSFWLAVYDSHIPGVPARVPGPSAPALVGPEARAVALEEGLPATP